MKMNCHSKQRTLDRRSMVIGMLLVSLSARREVMDGVVDGVDMGDLVSLASSEESRVALLKSLGVATWQELIAAIRDDRIAATVAELEFLSIRHVKVGDFAEAIKLGDRISRLLKAGRKHGHVAGSAAN
jgi:hypothetical protein